MSCVLLHWVLWAKCNQAMRWQSLSYLAWEWTRSRGGHLHGFCSKYGLLFAEVIPSVLLLCAAGLFGRSVGSRSHSAHPHSRLDSATHTVM